jgi:hypothetical protein
MSGYPTFDNRPPASETSRPYRCPASSDMTAIGFMSTAVRLRRALDALLRSGAGLGLTAAGPRPAAGSEDVVRWLKRQRPDVPHTCHNTRSPGGNDGHSALAVTSAGGPGLDRDPHLQGGAGDSVRARGVPDPCPYGGGARGGLTGTHRHHHGRRRSQVVPGVSQELCKAGLRRLAAPHPLSKSPLSQFVLGYRRSTGSLRKSQLTIFSGVSRSHA